jgi:RNA polymerase sigma-70 factor (ECF subfamily)
MSGTEAKNSQNHDKLNKETAVFVRAAQSGDEEAFRHLYDMYFDKIYSFIFFRTHHKEIAEDLAEDTFIKSWVRIASVQAESFGGWLYSIARNTLIDHYRKHKETVDLTEIEDILESPQDIVNETDLGLNQKILLDLIRKLNPEQQVVMQLKFIEGLENEEISDMLSKSEGSIRVTQHRAIQRLHELMEEHLETSRKPMPPSARNSQSPISIQPLRNSDAKH